MDKDITQIIEGVAAAKTVQALVRKYGDPIITQSFLYSAEQYVKDLKAAGYTVQAVDAAKTDAEIGEIIKQQSGYTFATGPANLRGTGKLTADPYTHQAAAGQKVASYMFPSVWGTSLVGVVALADSMKNFLGVSKYKLVMAAAGSSMVGDGVVRALGVDGTITAPSGFDVSKQPAMQYLDPSAMQNLQRLSSENQNLRNELAHLRSAQYPRGMPPGIPSYAQPQPQPVVQVSEIIPGKGAEAIKERTHMVGGQLQKATAESVRYQTGLVTLHGGR